MLCGLFLCVPIAIGIVDSAVQKNACNFRFNAITHYSSLIIHRSLLIIHLSLLIYFAGRETGVASGVKDSTTTLSATTLGGWGPKSTNIAPFKTIFLFF